MITRLLPRSSDYAGLRRSWRGDVVAGITVGVVALPLALAFGITSGLGATAGLMTAIVAGIVAGVFGGSNVQVSGPTGAMAVVLVPIVARYGADTVFLVGMMAGVLIVGAAVFRLGRYLAFIPWPVVEGFTMGIAVIIFLQQVPAALGVTKPAGENTAVIAARALVDSFSNGSVQAIALVVLVGAIMLIAPEAPPGAPCILARGRRRERRGRTGGMGRGRDRGASELATAAVAPRDLDRPGRGLARCSLRGGRARGDREPCCRPRSPTGWPTPSGTTPTASSSARGSPTSWRHCSAACRPRVRSPAPPSTCGPGRALGSRPSCTACFSCWWCCSRGRWSPASRWRCWPAC